MENKICCTCKNFLPISNFYKDGKRRDGLKTECKNCVKTYLQKYKKTDKYRAYISQYNKKYLEKNRDKIKICQREERYKRKYGINISDFNNLLESQEGKCAICETNNPGARGWNVDHNHKNGVVRGILCGNCNRAIGLFRDAPVNFHKAFLYLSC